MNHMQVLLVSCALFANCHIHHPKLWMLNGFRCFSTHQAVVLWNFKNCWKTSFYEYSLFLWKYSFDFVNISTVYLVYIKFSLCCNWFRKITLCTLAFWPVRTKIARPCTNYAYGHLTQACIYRVWFKFNVLKIVYS